MRKKIVVGGCLYAVLVAYAETPCEYRHLDGLASPERWSSAECDTSVSIYKAWEHPAIRMHIPIDFGAGEKQYPIGWPRMYLNLRPDEQNWQDYDRFEFRFFTDTSRTNLPKRPLIFHLYDGQGQKKLITIDCAAIGEWKTFSARISDFGLPSSVTRLGFNINESDYCDKDMINFHFGGFRLARGTVAQVTELKALTPALFIDSRVLPVKLVMEGPTERMAEGLPVQLRDGDRIILKRNVPVTRGRQIFYLPFHGTEIVPGTYSLVVCPDDPALRKETSVTITSSPWQMN